MRKTARKTKKRKRQPRNRSARAEVALEESEYKIGKKDENED
jgi:hypothetical protein